MEDYEIPKVNKEATKILGLIAGAIFVTALVLFVYYYTKINKPATSESHQINFTVERGLSSKQIAYKLKDQKVIGNSLVFLIYSSLHSAGSKFEAGEYILDSNMTIPEIVDVLTLGQVVSNDRALTIIEGWTNKQIAEFLISQKIIQNAEDLNTVLTDFSAEGGSASGGDFKYNDIAKQFSYQGFLFPDTYKLSQDAGATALIEKMLANFENKVTDKMIADIGTEHRDFKQIIILASIIEKEVGRNQETLTVEDLSAMQKERELVASVFYNRLQIGMPLESDATVNYITGKKDRQVLITDTKIKSPYNTYQIKGLPPTPISNPGIGSIEAAIYPQESNYLYFLNKPDGEAVFAQTLAQHNANRAKYLK